jgi:hypothetical protein
MHFHNLSRCSQPCRSLNAVAAGTGDTQNGTAIDTLDWDGIMFVFAFGTITASAVTTIKAQQGTTSNGSDAADLEGTSQSVADTDDNKILCIDIYRPRERYVRPVITRATANAVIDGVFAILYRGEFTPAAAHSTAVRVAEVFNSPAEGTA